VGSLYRFATEVWEPTTSDGGTPGVSFAESATRRAGRRRSGGSSRTVRSSRRHGATVVKNDRVDFELLRARLRVAVWLV
jgi:hypothetical protein